MNPLYRNDRAGAFPASWYADTAQIPDTRPALKGQHKADVCIVGAGYTGLTAALRLAEKGFKVIVLDAHRAGFGASGRNGGQVGSGYNQSQEWIANKLGEARARALWDLAEDSKSDLRALAAAHAPDARYTSGVAHGCYSDVEVQHEHYGAEYLSKTYGYDQMDFLDTAGFQAIVRSDRYKGGILDHGAGHIHPLRYAIGLARAAEAAGAVICEMSEVHNIAHGQPAKVQTGAGHVMADHVILAGNGYLPNIEGHVAARVMPINSFICATEPLTPEQAVLTRDIAVADDKFVVNYFRMTEDNRLLFGGRENYGIGFPTDIKTKLVARMHDMFPQTRGVGISHVWGGTLGITMTRLPALQRIAPNVLSGAGFSGHGVALSGFSGRVMAEAIAGQAEKLWYALRDRFGL